MSFRKQRRCVHCLWLRLMAADLSMWRESQPKNALIVLTWLELAGAVHLLSPGDSGKDLSEPLRWAWLQNGPWSHPPPQWWGGAGGSTWHMEDHQPETWDIQQVTRPWNQIISKEHLFFPCFYLFQLSGSRLAAWFVAQILFLRPSHSKPLEGLLKGGKSWHKHLL